MVASEPRSAEAWARSGLAPYRSSGWWRDGVLFVTARTAFRNYAWDVSPPLWLCVFQSLEPDRRAISLGSTLPWRRFVPLYAWSTFIMRGKLLCGYLHFARGQDC